MYRALARRDQQHTAGIFLNHRRSENRLIFLQRVFHESHRRLTLRGQRQYLAQQRIVGVTVLHTRHEASGYPQRKRRINVHAEVCMGQSQQVEQLAHVHHQIGERS